MPIALVVFCLVDETILLEFPVRSFPAIDRKHDLKQSGPLALATFLTRLLGLSYSIRALHIV